jgi:NAD+ synthase (glutamine-hydrolysing)
MAPLAPRRFDHRPFLYNWRWPWQFTRMDELAQQQQQQQQQAEGRRCAE